MSFFQAGIKSIQRGTISIPNAGATSITATLSPAVDTAKTELRYLGYSSTGSGTDEHPSRVVLTNSTTVTATRGATANGDVVVSWEITERYR